MWLRRAIKLLLAVMVIAATALALLTYSRRSPQNLPWTSLDLAHPIGAFTGRKLAGLAQDKARCHALMDRAGIQYAPLPPKRGAQCAYKDVVRLAPAGARTIALTPPAGVSCPMAAALAVWEWQIVQPAALRHLGRPISRIDHYGSYSCRRLYGRSVGDWSEHAAANALDVAGFRTDDGQNITIRRDWNGETSHSAFLHEVRDGACKLFSTVLSPDYNAAHADHLHLDQAKRGEMGWRMCG